MITVVLLTAITEVLASATAEVPLRVTVSLNGVKVESSPSTRIVRAPVPAAVSLADAEIASSAVAVVSCTYDVAPPDHIVDAVVDTEGLYPIKFTCPVPAINPL